MVKLSDFSKNTFTLVLGTVIAQAIPLALHPLLRRMYSAEDFGAMAVYLNLFGVITIVSALRYEAAIVLPKRNNEGMNILSLTFIINLVFCALTFFSILFFKEGIVRYLNFPSSYSDYLYVLPFACLLFGTYQGMNYWLIRQKAFKASTSNKIIRRVAEGGVQTAFGALKLPGGLFIGDFIGNLINNIVGIKQIIKNGFETKFVSIRKMKFVSRRYDEYPKYNVLPTLLSSVANVLPFLFINKFYSTEIVGYLDLTKLVLSIPLIFISATISQVLFQQITEKKHNALSVKGDMRNVLFLLLGVVLFEIILIIFLAPMLFGFVFGKTYELSGEFAQLLVYSFAFNFIGSAFSSVFMTFEKIKMNSVWQIVYFTAICCLWFFKNLSIYDFLKVYVAIEVVMHLSYCILIYWIVNKYENKIVIK